MVCPGCIVMRRKSVLDELVHLSCHGATLSCRHDHDCFLMPGKVGAGHIAPAGAQVVLTRVRCAVCSRGFACLLRMHPAAARPAP